eukprot:6236803-Prymnesium_polylepis.1
MITQEQRAQQKELQVLKLLNVFLRFLTCVLINRNGDLRAGWLELRARSKAAVLYRVNGVSLKFKPLAAGVDRCMLAQFEDRVEANAESSHAVVLVVGLSDRQKIAPVLVPRTGTPP